ncbi:MULTISPECIES: hypothetical protein [Pedobacter]|uniref:hypothetical protein n=1 Tax=Pedobacter TaxID=84567 RepID=UPI00293075D2|nr:MULTISPECIES: hypothetical protein [Pedobacter]
MKLNQQLLFLKKNFFVTFCFIALLSLCIYQTWLRNKENIMINELSRSIDTNSDKKHIFDRVQFSPDIVDSLNKLKKEKLLVFRFLRNDCHECIDSIFSNLSYIAKGVGKENLVVLVDEPNMTEYLKYKRLYQEKISNFFYCPSQVSAIDKEGISYYSVFSGRDNSSGFIFLTRPLEYPAQTRNYLKGIVDVF